MEDSANPGPSSQLLDGSCTICHKNIEGIAESHYNTHLNEINSKEKSEKNVLRKHKIKENKRRKKSKLFQIHTEKRIEMLANQRQLIVEALWQNQRIQNSADGG
ncbi:hypothetical protein QE152_g9463 [Popillia japonica]|uniref:Uncharacterized protein n=1 Tax=Popillia japonica TaxID=7064 RepID=A0AAW1LY92_POPJA